MEIILVTVIQGITIHRIFKITIQTKLTDHHTRIKTNNLRNLVILIPLPNKITKIMGNINSINCLTAMVVTKTSNHNFRRKPIRITIKIEGFNKITAFLRITVTLVKILIIKTIGGNQIMTQGSQSRETKRGGVTTPRYQTPIRRTI